MLLSPTVQRDKEADGVLGDPLADAIARALLDAGDQGGVVDDAVEDLAPGRLGRAHGDFGLGGPRGQRAATHGGGDGDGGGGDNGGGNGLGGDGVLVAAMRLVWGGCGRGRMLICEPRVRRAQQQQQSWEILRAGVWGAAAVHS